MASPDAGRGGFGVAVYGWKEVGLDSQADQILTAIREKNQQMCFFHSETRKDCSNQRK
jgi:hypothetical protein